jgi:hypothetical protein
MATGLDANGNLLPGFRYVTYHDGVGQGTPINTADAAATYQPGSTGANLAGLNIPDFAANPNPQQAQMQQVAARTSPASTFGPPQGMNQPRMPMIPQFGWQGSATQMGMNRPWNMGGMERNPFMGGFGMGFGGGMFGMPYRMGQMPGFGGGQMFGRYQMQQPYSFGGMGGSFMGRPFRGLLG